MVSMGRKRLGANVVIQETTMLHHKELAKLNNEKTSSRIGL